MDIDASVGTGREVCQRLLARGILVKDTHGQTLRIAPPLVVTGDEVDFIAHELALALH